MRALRTPGAVKDRGVRKVLGFQNTSLERVRVSIQVPSLVHENHIISMTDGCQTQASSLFGRVTISQFTV